jgi:hypothetical protein
MNTSVKKPPTKVVEGLTLILEELLKKPKLRIESTPHLTSVVFPQSKIPSKIGEIREEFYNRGFFFFYSEVVEKKQILTFFNLSKMV